jgi:Ran GTPase-activating protein (RanGAP) involved in mRNA processing and transport
MNYIYEEGASHVARFLHFVDHLYLSRNPIGNTGVSLISEVVGETTTLKTLILHDCSITSRGAEDLSRALALNSSLEKLDISRNDLGDEGVSHVAEALEQNKQLKELWIGGGVITDKGAASLASALTVNNSLKMLNIGGDEEVFSEDGLSTIAHSLANKSSFMELAIPSNLDVSTTIFSVSSTTSDHLRWDINEVRERNGLPPIEIIGEYTVCCLDVPYQFIYILLF